MKRSFRRILTLLGPGAELDVVVDAEERPLASNDVVVNVTAGAASRADDN